MLGERIGGYVVVKQIGAGGMGAVYLAENRHIDRKVAVKVLLPELSRQQQVVARFFAEARAASVIKHPGIVEIIDCNVLPNGDAYIVMEFLEGESLGGLLRRIGSLNHDVGTLMRVGADVANAMAAAHASGIVHRDLKPDNIHLAAAATTGAGSWVKVLDFGIAKLIERDGRTTAETRAGTLLGTPLYMSPEQCRGDAHVNHLSDVYALGCVLFEMAAGRPPFASDNAAELIAAHLTSPPPPLRVAVPHAPPELEALILQMMAKVPPERGSGMVEVEARLRALLGGAGRMSATMGIVPGAQPGPGGAWSSPLSLSGTAPPTGRPTAGGTVILPADEGQTENTSRPRKTGGRRAPGREKAAPPPARGVWPLLVVVGGVVVLGGGGLAAYKLGAFESGAGTKVKPKPIQPGLHPARPDAALAHFEAPPGMAAVAAATFTMGSQDGEIDAALSLCKSLGVACKREIYERESPARPVKVSAFFLDTTEVTNTAFAAWLSRQRTKVAGGRVLAHDGQPLASLNDAAGLVADGAGFRARDGRGEQPVVAVTWVAAARFCGAVKKRLPTEAEWELAARGTNRRLFPWGELPPVCGDVVFGQGEKNGNCKATGPAPVGTHAADRTPEGVFDLGGNVAEWVSDALVIPYPACDGACIDPVVTDAPSPNGPRVVRGGAFQLPADAARGAGRSRSLPNDGQINVGFRCAKDS